MIPLAGRAGPVSGTRYPIRAFPTFGGKQWHKQLGKDLVRPSARRARAANPKYKRRSREPWTQQEVRELRSLAKGNTPTGVISLKLQRPPAGIRSKAQREGISLKPANHSPYNRRKRAR